MDKEAQMIWEAYQSDRQHPSTSYQDTDWDSVINSTDDQLSKDLIVMYLDLHDGDYLPGHVDLDITWPEGGHRGRPTVRIYGRGGQSIAISDDYRGKGGMLYSSLEDGISDVYDVPINPNNLGRFVSQKIREGDRIVVTSDDIIQSQSALGGELYRLKTKLVEDGGLMPAEWSAGAFKSKDGNWKGRLTAINSMMKGWVSDQVHSTPEKAIEEVVNYFEDQVKAK